MTAWILLAITVALIIGFVIALRVVGRKNKWERDREFNG